jgi:branched-chain amino acid transport system permease protein
MAIREDEIAAKAMGINTRNMKLLAFGMGASFGGVSGAMFAAFQGFVSPESFSLMESVMIVAMVVLGGIGHLPGVILGAILLAALPEVLRYVAGPLQSMTGGRLDASILRQLFIALAMIVIMLVRPRGLWPSPEHGKTLTKKGGVPVDPAHAAVAPGSLQTHAPGVDTPADELPGAASRPMSINP